MKLEFLSDAWFDRVEELTAAAGDLQIPPDVPEIDINLTANRAGTPILANVRHGLFSRGHRPSASLTMTCPLEVAKLIFIGMDPAAGMQAFMLGEVTFEGDVEAVASIAEADRGERHAALLDEVRTMTLPPGRTPKAKAQAKPKAKAKPAKAKKPAAKAKKPAAKAKKPAAKAKKPVAQKQPAKRRR